MRHASAFVTAVVLFSVFQPAFGKDSRRLLKHPAKEQRQPEKKGQEMGSAVVTSEDEEQRYEAAKEKAKADPVIRQLKEKSDAATGVEEGREAAITYFRALFNKIRKMDASLVDRANLAEEALMQRLKH